MSAGAADRVDARIDALMIRDRDALRGLSRAIERRESAGKPATRLRGKLHARLARAEERLAERRAGLPSLRFPEDLPISALRERIIAALNASQVLVVCGDTGSGKTTQLPKLCLAAGRGLRGSIGHTQPRRIAARAAAARLAGELGAELGREVGYKVRFDDTSQPSSLIKVMTDGVLLNEIREDRLLSAYDTLIIDEAHERSLNIDFLLGYLKRLLPRRPDLKLIITSATIDPARFAAHFDGAPVLHVEGRAYAVEHRYRPLQSGQDLNGAILAAVAELDALDPAALGGGPHKDILVFLPGERWIRDAEDALRRAGPRHYEVLPLYARLPAARQQRIFEPGSAPRIVLATNVAETSLTVPRIRYVIDSGLARVGRYAARHRVQHLGVEPIARANADQRAGRCGRLAPGICVRLFAEDDYESRPRFADPEMLRTGLADVILQLEAMRLGHVDEFPFLDAPPRKAVNDAYRLLHVLGAVDADNELTADGALMGRLPLDPRLARLLIAAKDNGSLRDALVLAAGLSVTDPREQPPGRLDAARRAQREFEDARSDFVTLLNLWRAWRAQRRRGRKALREWSERRCVSIVRLNEWQDVHRQLAELVDELGWRRDGKAADYRELHEAVLAAFIDFVAQRDDGARYRGMHEARAMLFPGTPLIRKKPRWIVAAEHVATERAYLRTVAQINPRWALRAAPHLLKRDYRDPVWHRDSGRVLVREVVTLFGLTVSAKRRIDYAGIDASAARRLFIEQALARGELGGESAVLEHNRALCRRIFAWEARLRSRDLFVGERGVGSFYDERLPADVTDRERFMAYCRDEAAAGALRMRCADLATRDITALPAELYPATLEAAGHSLELRYCYEPGSDADGVTVRVPRVLLGSLRAERLEWLIPGWLEEKVAALLRTLPKARRRELVPLPDTVRSLLPELEIRAGRQPLVPALCEVLAATRRLRLAPDALDPRRLPPHLSMRVEVLEADGSVMAAGRDLIRLQRRHAASGAAASALAPSRDAGPWARRGLSRWSFPDLPETVRVRQYARELALYPALVDADGRVDLTLLPPGPPAVAKHRRGVRRLLLKCLPQQTALIGTRLHDDRALLLAFHGVGTSAELADDLLLAAAESCFDLDAPPRCAAEFEARLAAGRAELVDAAEQCRALLAELLPRHRDLRASLADASLPDRAAADIGAQLDGLIHPYFLSRTPQRWRARLPTYLRAIEMRIDKARGAGGKDAEHQRRVEDAGQRFSAWRKGRPPGWPMPAAMHRYRWMLEEYRVSLFAQALGTAMKVSARRLDEAWQAALEESRQFI